MTSTETKINLPIFNIMPASVYDNLTTVNPDEFYFVDPQFQNDKLLVTDADGEIVEATAGNNISVTNGTVNVTSDYYGTCSTAASTQTKVVVCPGFVLKEGVSIRVKFANSQTYNGQAKLDVNNTGAIGVCSYGTTASVRYCWYAGEVVSFTYDGTNWIMEDAFIATTSYYGVTALTTSATNTSGSRALTPASLNSLVLYMIEPYPVYSTSGTYNTGDRVRYSYQAWEAQEDNITGTWDATKWEALDPVQTQIDNLTLNQLSNVNITSPTQGQNLTYDATNNVWKNTSTSATVAWGGITGTLSDQTDLQTALNSKANTSDLATVATSGDYDDLTNKPTIPMFISDLRDDTAQSPIAVANALKDQNTGLISKTVKTWTGTQAEYNALPAFYSWYHSSSTRTYYTKSLTPEVGQEVWSILSGYFGILYATLVTTLVTPNSEGFYYDSSNNRIVYNDGGGSLTYFERDSEGDLANRIDSGTLYFCTDTGNLYKGTTLINRSKNKFSNLPTFGALNYEDGIVSGFNAGSWGGTNSFHPSSSTWKINWKFTYKTSSSDNQIIIDMTNGYSSIRPLTCFTHFTTGKICYGLSSNGTSFDILNQVDGSHSLVDGTTYYLKLEFTGTQYIFSLSTNGTTYETDLSVTSSTPIYDTSDYSLCVGLYRTGSSAIFLDSMDLNYCSIDIGGQRVWEGIKIIDTLEDVQNVIYQYNPSPVTIFGYACPSTSYNDITKPATGGTITAPHDGFIMFVHRVASAGQFIALGNAVRHMYTQANASANNMLLRAWLPCRKGDTITIEYTGSSTTTSSNSLRCIRAIGGR